MTLSQRELLRRIKQQETTKVGTSSRTSVTSLGNITKKINNRRNNYINSHLDKNPNAGKFNFMKTRAKTYNIISQVLQVLVIRVYNKNIK